MASAFEGLVGKEMEIAKTALLSHPAADICGVARIQGRYAGLAQALALFKRSNGPDEDRDDV